METTKENILTKKYEVGRLLGKGTFAKVYYGRNVQTGQGVAVKVIDKGKILRGGLMDQTKREISVMRMVKHQNIVQLYEVMATKTKIYFVMEYAKGGELFHKVSKSRLDEDVARNYFQQLMCAVSFCHMRGVHHRDLKPENLLLDESGTLKVSDFGLSALPESKRKDGLLHTTCGTPAYVAPEVISRRGYDGAKADIWSCGVILFVLLAGYLPFYEPNVVEMYKKISSAEYKFPSWFPYDVRRLISRILDPNPKTRISIAKIMSHPWFRKGFDDDDPLPEDISPKIELDESMKPSSLNAFDIISLSSGFDLSGLFVSSDQKDAIQFSSTKSAREIVSRFEEICCFLSLRVTKKDGVGSMRLERGRMEMDVSIFEISSSFHLVEVKRCGGGDSYEYHRLMRRDFRPALRDIVWAWH